MADYDLTKEDWEAVIEVGQFEGQRDPVASIPSKVRTFIRKQGKNSRYKLAKMEFQDTASARI